MPLYFRDQRACCVGFLDPIDGIMQLVAIKAMYSIAWTLMRVVSSPSL